MQKLVIWIFLLVIFFPSATYADFFEDFTSADLGGWSVQVGSGDLQTGMGDGKTNLTQKNGIGLFHIDATRDRRNIWWAVIKHEITSDIDAEFLGRPDKAIRIEARVRFIKPRRFNMSLNHTRTTDYHADLAEFDIADTCWHVVSYTNRAFSATPEDRVFVQLALIDAGQQVHDIEIDYIRVSLIDTSDSSPDLGDPLPYRPPLPDPSTFDRSLTVFQDAIIDAAYPWVNFNTWHDASSNSAPLLSVSGSQLFIMRWDFSGFSDISPVGWGVLVITTHNISYAPSDLEEFGYLRTVEIRGGDRAWKRATVTMESLLLGRPQSEIIIPQLIMDAQPVVTQGGKTMIGISPPVMERLISGKTNGLAVLAQGALNAAFYSSQASEPNVRPVLYFNVRFQ